MSQDDDLTRRIEAAFRRVEGLRDTLAIAIQAGAPPVVTRRLTAEIQAAVAVRARLLAEEAERTRLELEALLAQELQDEPPPEEGTPSGT